MKRKVQVHIADDHKIVIEGVIAVINTESSIEVKGYSQTGTKVIKWLEKNSADVLILDISMPEVGGIEVLRYFKEKGIEQKTIILSSFDDPNFVKEIMEIGAKGYISKNNAGEHIVNAILKVANGGTYFSDDIKENLFKVFTGEEAVEGDFPKGFFISEELTDREVEVLRLIAKELNTSEIAKKINVSENTVKTHRQKLLKKLNVKNSVGLAMYAVKHKII
ncbi:LuxR family two component transcriptional regulator [Lutibacter sp. Hel_I_33_5]|uniref:response regulator n=1 Tax=Lutibacter sp. Hel_I_33_5 TaxID=1566289 RepID=UPI0011A26A92|nr:response regulator transcription factor [Lutibacter sp. Hel_I_33_5]TVZ55805.1 LuxR family two component transcriptional regulator [Lutibacter sp. Hel_I_33_5]